MRKALALSCVLLLLATAGLCGAGVIVNAARDQVQYTVNMIYGDPAAAEGLVVENRAEMDRHLFWDTTYETGEEPVTDTEYEFYEVEQERSSEITYSGVQLEISPSTILETVDIWQYEEGDEVMREEAEGIARAYYELYDQVEAGKEGEMTVSVKDYYEYYPVSVFIDLPDYHWNGNYENFDLGSGMAMFHVEAFQEFFRIPVLETEQVKIGLAKNAGGKVASTSGGSGEGDNFYLTTERLLTDEACYFTFSTRTTEDNIIDTSQITGGYGIYRLPYHTEISTDSTQVKGEPKEMTVIDIEEMAMVYPLDPSVRLTGFYLSPDEERILLFTTEAEEGSEGVRCFLTVIDLATMETVQRLELAEFSDKRGAVWNVFIDEEFLSLRLYDDRLVVLELTEEGIYEIRIMTDTKYEELSEYQYYNDSTTDMDWDGEKLVIAGSLLAGRNDIVRYTPGFYLAVYDAGGLLYYVEYASSLSTGWSRDRANYYCSPDEDPITVEWKE